MKTQIAIIFTYVYIYLYISDVKDIYKICSIYCDKILTIKDKKIDGKVNSDEIMWECKAD